MKSAVLEDGRVVYGGEPPLGCQLCARGEKLVVFVTGLCNFKCFYCPVSKKRKLRDLAYANERLARSIDDVLDEVWRTGAKGAGVTGGEPLLRLGRTIAVIRSLKEAFGSSFHVHLYTNGLLATPEALRALERAGLDELRFHPVDEEVAKRVKLAKEKTSMAVGAEVPALPGSEAKLLRLAKELEEAGADFLNVNEAEVSETNAASLALRGFRVSSDGVTVLGSREAAMRFLSLAEASGLELTVHFCPASFKTAVQTRLRYERTAALDAQVYERVREGYVIEWLEVEVAEGCEDLAAELASRGEAFEVSRAGATRVYALASRRALLALARSGCLSRAVKKRALPTLPRLVVEEEPLERL